MTKMFENSKKVLAFVLAFAVMAVSLFTGMSLTASAEDASIIYATGTPYWEPDSVTFDEGTGTEADPYIISNVGQIRALVQGKTEIGKNSAGKFFKVADNVKVICLQAPNYFTEETYTLDDFLTLEAEEVKDFFAENATNCSKWQSAGGKFAGTLDFNGAHIVGCYNVNGGLFQEVGMGAVIKNFELSHSYIEGGDYVGSVVSVLRENGENKGKVTFENAIIHDNYVKNTGGNKASRTGVLIGGLRKNCGLSYSNLLTYGNKTDGTDRADYELVGDFDTGWNGLGTEVPNGDFNTSVFLDCVPYPISEVNNQGTRSEYWHGIYSAANCSAYKPNHWAELKDCDITVIDNFGATGADALEATPKLFTGGWVAVEGAAPVIRGLHNFTFTDGGDGTHSGSCDCGCGLTAVKTNHVWADGVCAYCPAVCTHPETEEKVASAATCTAAGKINVVCTTCGKIVETKEDPNAPAKGHDWSNKDGKCVACETECAHGTTSDAFEFVVVTPATCTENATYNSVCKTCGKVMNGDTPIDATNVPDGQLAGHKLEKVEGKDADCTNAGTKTYYICKNGCGAAFEDEAGTKAIENLDEWKVIAVKGHTAAKNDDGTTKYVDGGDGKHYKECSICDVKYDGEDHVYDDDNDTDCNVCGAVRVFDWAISVDATGVYDIAPEKTVEGFSAKIITIVDKNDAEVKYNEKNGGWPLVKGEEYTLKLSDDADKAAYADVVWVKESKAATIFADTTADGWYNDAVNYAVGSGIMTGYQSNGLFGTSDSIQRQDFILMLARYAGADLDAYATAENIFPDVDNNGYYAAAVKWGVDKGIITGYTHNGMFGVGDTITREQLVTMLYRYAKNVLGNDVTVSDDAEANASEKFNDCDKVSVFSKEAVLWATDKGVINGKGENHDAIDPQGNAQRCEVAQIMYNIFKNDIFSKEAVLWPTDKGGIHGICPIIPKSLMN